MTAMIAEAHREATHKASMEAYNAYLIKRQNFIDDLEKLFKLALEAQDFKAALKAKEFIGKTLRFFWASRTDKTPCPKPSTHIPTQPYPTEPHLSPSPISSTPSSPSSLSLKASKKPSGTAEKTHENMSPHKSVGESTASLPSSPPSFPTPRNRAERRWIEKIERQKTKTIISPLIREK